MNPADLSFAMAEAVALIAANPELDGDDELRADAIEGETTVNEVMARLVDAVADAEAMDDALAKRIEAMRTRRARYQDRQARLRMMMRHLIDAANLSAIRLPEATITRGRDSVSLDLAEGFAPPQGYGRVKVDPDKAAIKAALMNGETMEGATLITRPGTVSIRR